MNYWSKTFWLFSLEFKYSGCKGDVGFLIDGSGSIVKGYGPGRNFFEYYWNLILDFIVVLAKPIGISDSGSRMAVVVFSDDAELVIKFSDHQNYDSFEKSVLAINHPMGLTNTLIYLTDGECNGNYINPKRPVNHIKVLSFK